MRALLALLILPLGLAGQADPVRTVVDRLSLDRYKAHIKGLSQFGDRMEGTDRNRAAIGWLEVQLRSFGYTNVERHRFMGRSGPLENIYATKIGSTHPGEMYLVSAHMDGIGGGEAADDDASGCAVVLELARVLAAPGVSTDRSVRFIFWNSEETGMEGSEAYVRDRGSLQGEPGEPKWLGMIQHDMMMFDHGFPPRAAQSATADINIEFRARSKRARASAELAEAFLAANQSIRAEFPATIGVNMDGTDSVSFMDLIPSISVREAERLTGIVRGSNPHHHEPTDRYDTYAEEDFRLGFAAAQTSLMAIGRLAGLRHE